MNINIPDKIYKLFVLIGIALVVYSVVFQEDKSRELNEITSKYARISDTLEFTNYKIKANEKRLLESAEILAKSENIVNPLVEKDSVLTFYFTTDGDTKQKLAEDSLWQIWQSHKDLIFKQNLSIKKAELLKNELKNSEKVYAINSKIRTIFETVGVILFLLGVLTWMLDEMVANSNKKIDERIYKFCQSCGKKFNSMRKYGTNSNNTENYAFCKDCFQNGEFTTTNLSEEDFILQFENEIKNESWLKKIILRSRIRNLERWRNSDY